jgi:hypothetical protein
MKLMHILVASAAILASSACNAEKGHPLRLRPRRSSDCAAGRRLDQDGHETPDGGFVMGNPNAPVKLIEYGSLTCLHCAEFDEKGAKSLIDNYVKAGQAAGNSGISFAIPTEPRSVVAAVDDQPPTRGLYAEQKDWIAKIRRLRPSSSRR